MLEYLSTGKKYSIQELADILEVSPRMIRVYKDSLEEAGIYIDTIKGPYGGYVLNQQVSIPKRFISPNTVEVKDKNILNTMNRAVKEHRKVYIAYESQTDHTISKRTIHPFELLLYGNEWGVAAYCELKREMRHFYINNIKEIELLEKYEN